MSRFRIYTERTHYGQHEKLAILVEDVNGVVAVVEPLVFSPVNPAEVGKYTLDIPYTTERVDGRGDRHFTALDARALMQAFLDHAWELGLRPTGDPLADTTKQIAAMSAHLNDMRALVFKMPPSPPRREDFDMVRKP